MKSAYLIVICDSITNRILEIDIWSQPPWMASRRLGENVVEYVLYETKHSTFSEARQSMLAIINRKEYGYRWTCKYFSDRLRKDLERNKNEA